MGLFTLLKFIPVLKMVIPLVIALVAGSGILAIGKTIRDGASAQAHLAIVTEINRSNSVIRDKVASVTSDVETERDRLRADDALHRQEIDRLKAKLEEARAKTDLEGLIPCPVSNCKLDWLSDS